MQMQLSAEQNVFEMKSLRSGAARREASGNGNRYQHFASISISYILLIYIQFSVFFFFWEFLYCCNSFQWAALITASENLTF